ncbi:MAG: PQQ-binding-like beta-propeller repeat protein [Acidobacteria bacterium]|nr:PQQ-binding-like beta-propeller repeat protein [Acidobacteriota bacterium]MYH21557.1 PQQ-binding-like beta-propeller repeat protein [Acidobacteriota bacterium]MYK80175.1 PQQ-binding-like beta-propeller repeat protein [Acidobacteriota bacterium]
MKRQLVFPLLVLSLAAGAAAQDGDDWPQFRRDAALTGIAAAPLGDDLELKWSVPLGFSVESSPAIAGGFVYATSLPGVLVKLNLEDGAEAWRYRPGAGEAEAGEFEEDRFGESSPAVAGGTVYVGDLLGVLHGVDADSGEPRWLFPTGAEIKSSPVVAGDLVLIGSYDEHFYGVDRATGKARWSLQTEGPVHATPGRHDGLAWVTGCDAVLRGVRITDGTEMLRFDSGAYTAASPAIADGTLYYGTFNNEVLAVDVGAGKLRWRYEHPDRHFPFYASAALADGLVIAAGRDKLIHALDRATGEAHWTFRARARFDASPAVAGDRVYVGNADGRLYVLDLETGEKLSEFHAGAAIMGSPAVAGGRIVFGTQDGTLFALGPRTY